MRIDVSSLDENELRAIRQDTGALLVPDSGNTRVLTLGVAHPRAWSSTTLDDVEANLQTIALWDTTSLQSREEIEQAALGLRDLKTALNCLISIGVSDVVDRGVGRS